MVIWRITKKLNNKTYYYVGLENRGRRVWSTNMSAAATWLAKEEAIKIWNDDVGCGGSITGEEESNCKQAVLDDLIAQAWNKGGGWVI